MAGIVENPTRYTVIILTKQLFLAGRYLHLVKVVPRFVAIIYTNVDEVRFRFRNLVNKGAGTLGVGQIYRYRNLRTRGRSGGRIDSKNVKVFIAVIIFVKEDVFAVPTPKITGDRPFSLSSQRPRFVKRLVYAFNPDIPDVLERLKE